MKVVVDGTTVASAPREELIEIEGNLYFPPTAIAQGSLLDSPTPYTCPWKGAAVYHHVVTTGGIVPDAAWRYPELLPSAIEQVGRDFSGYVAFDPALVTIT